MEQAGGDKAQRASRPLLLAHPCREHARAFVVHVEQPTRPHPVPPRHLPRTKTDPSFEQGRQEQRRPRVMGRKHAGNTAALPQMRKQVIEHRLFIVGQQPAVRGQGLQS